MLSVMKVSEITFASIVGKVSELQTIGIFMKASIRKSIMQDVILVIKTLFKNIISHCIKENIIQVNNDLKSKEIRFKFDKLTSVKMFFRLFHAFAIFSFQYFIYILTKTFSMSSLLPAGMFTYDEGTKLFWFREPSGFRLK